MPWTRRRKVATTGLAIACTIVVGLVVTTYAGNWGAIAHWSCQKGPSVVNEVMWIPVILINAPYGGYASGNGSLPQGYLGPHTYLLSASGTAASNGSVAGVIYQVWLNVSTDENRTVFGPGANIRCTQEFEVSPGGTGPQPPNAYAGRMFGPGLTSDANEPHNWTLGPGNSTVWFSNGFTNANTPPVSTCGVPARNVYIPVHGVTVIVQVPFSVGGGSVASPLVLPLSQSYHYSFPADFGTWQVDNLSAPGGPGGGWAFSYSPCA